MSNRQKISITKKVLYVCRSLERKTDKLKSYKIKVKVIKILEKGECPLNLKVGDEFIFEHLPPPEFCHWAFHSMLPFITALRFGGNIPWEEKEGACHLCCPDPNNPVVFEITRIEKE